MANLMLDPDTHDIIPGRQMTRVSGALYVAQLVKCRLLTFLGEWVLDRNIGAPWYGVLERHYDISATRLAIKNIIETTSGVLVLETLDLQADSRARQLKVQFTAKTVHGGISEVIEI